MDFSSFSDAELSDFIKKLGINPPTSRQDKLTYLSLLGTKVPGLGTPQQVTIRPASASISIPPPPSIRPPSVPVVPSVQVPPIITKVTVPPPPTISKVPVVSRVSVPPPPIISNVPVIPPPLITQVRPPSVSMVRPVAPAPSIPPLPPAPSIPPVTPVFTQHALPSPFLGLNVSRPITPPPIPLSVVTRPITPPPIPLPVVTRPATPPLMPPLPVVTRPATPPRVTPFLGPVVTKPFVIPPPSGQFLKFGPTVQPTQLTQAVYQLDRSKDVEAQEEATIALVAMSNARGNIAMSIESLIENLALLRESVGDVSHHLTSSNFLGTIKWDSSQGGRQEMPFGDMDVTFRKHPAGMAYYLSKYAYSFTVMADCVSRGPWFIEEVVSYAGFGGLNLRIDEYVALIFYLSLSDNTYLRINNLHFELKLSLNRLAIQSIETLKEAMRSGPWTSSHLNNRSRFELLLMAIGRVTLPPLPSSGERYDKFLTINPECIILASIGYYTNIKQSTIAIPPYAQMATSEPKAMERFININVEADNSAIYKTAGMMIPPRPPLPPKPLRFHNRFFLHNLWTMEPFLTRGTSIMPPPALADIDPEFVSLTLSQYSDYELFDAYDPPVFDWKRRADLIDQIYNTGSGGAKWNIGNVYCNNDAFDSVTLAEPMGSVNKNDPEDPIFSYGVAKNYRCYLMSDLVASFREMTGDDGEKSFVFAVPDYVPPLQRSNPKLNYAEMREFSIKSMKQLLELAKALVDYKKVNNVSILQPLIDKLTVGIQQRTGMMARLNLFNKIYNGLTGSQKRAIEDYILNIFIYGMYNRYWKGPGYPWPGVTEDTTGLCTATQREGYAIDEFKRISARLGAMDQTTLNLALLLPRVTYQWSNGSFNMLAGPDALTDKTTARTPYDFDPKGVPANELEMAKRIADIQRLAYQYPALLYYVLLKVNEGKFCQNNASDVTTQSGYVYARKLFGWTDAKFNQELRSYLGRNDQPEFRPRQMTRHGDIDPEDRRISKVAEEGEGFI